MIRITDDKKQISTLWQWFEQFPSCHLNHNSSRDCDIYRLWDVEPRCTVSDSNYGCRTYYETFTHQQSLLSIPFPWNTEYLARIRFVPIFKSLVAPGWGPGTHSLLRTKRAPYHYANAGYTYASWKSNNTTHLTQIRASDTYDGPTCLSDWK